MSNVVTTKFVRKPMFVDAVQVTSENFHAVAEWCQGVIRSADGIPVAWETGETHKVEDLHIHVRVQSPKNEKQTQARVGDWILYMDRGGYKVYTDRAFQHSFDAHTPQYEITNIHVTPSVSENQIQMDEELQGKAFTDDPFAGVPRVTDTVEPEIPGALDSVPDGSEHAGDKSEDDGSVEVPSIETEPGAETERNPIEMTEQERIAQIKAEARQQ